MKEESTTDVARKARPLTASEGASPRMRRSPLLFAAGLITLALALAFWWWPRHPKGAALIEKPPAQEAKEKHEEGAAGHEEHSQEGAVEVSEETAKLIGLMTEKVAEGRIEEAISTTGKVMAAPGGQAIIGAKVSGRALSVRVEPGQAVKQGQVLVIVDSPEIAGLRGQLIEARSKLTLAEQRLDRTRKNESRVAAIQARNRLDLATAALERKRRLVALGAVANREVAEAETEYKNAQAEYDFQSNIQVAREQQEAQSELEQARATVSRLTESLSALGATPTGKGGAVNIASPISGTVVDRHVSIGETVTPEKELMSVINVANVVIEAQMPEAQANRIRSGQRLVARIPGQPDRTFEGKISSISSVVDPEKRTVAVRAPIANQNALLKHEMAVEIRIVSSANKNALLVPASALVDDEGIKVVYVKEGDRYERRPVSVGTINFKTAEILSGVEAGEEVVTEGAYQLKNMAKGGGEEGGHHDDH
ncbi:MAG TPA: efflux RND transporter periplasmic adaptor subunit [Blastocatellia bacterium]|nr:efflux RND transporter periplasmic adaptor subunit [Blastocatellia bacterium]